MAVEVQGVTGTEVEGLGAMAKAVVVHGISTNWKVS